MSGRACDFCGELIGSGWFRHGVKLGALELNACPHCIAWLTALYHDKMLPEIREKYPMSTARDASPEGATSPRTSQEPEAHS